MAKRTVSADNFRHYGAYERLRQAILEDPKHERLDRTLAYWVLPADRRLPVAFLREPLRNIVSKTLDELLTTPGIGQKKITGLLTLLKRALKSPSEEDFGMTEAGDTRRGKGKKSFEFDPLQVSEELWSTWRDTVRRCGMENYTLGQLAPTLDALPTVIWNATLNDYLGLTLQEIHNLKTHGEKRVHAIIEVFCGVHEAVSTATLQEHIEMVLLPKFVPPVQRWISTTLDSNIAPTTEALHEHVALPLVKQIVIDLGKPIAKLADSRVSLSDNAPPVRAHAKRMNITRARVYQLLDECAAVMKVRWPEGRWLLAPLRSLIALNEDVEALAQFRAINDLFFPQLSQKETSGIRTQKSLATKSE